MAGTRQQVGNRLCISFVLFLLFHVYGVYSDVQCLSATGENIDWFIVYKLPLLEEDNHDTSGDRFYYMDANSPEWKFSSVGMSDSGHAVSNTLQQIYKNLTQGSDSMYLMYNDEKPDGLHDSSKYGHTKGVVAFGKSAGFWMLHSTPKFPPKQAEGYTWPTSGDINGQTFLCISLSKSAMDNLGVQLQYNYPQIYDKYFPRSLAAKFPQMAAVAMASSQKHPTREPWYRQTRLISLGGQEFISFAKFSKFGKDLYSAWLAESLSGDLYVETWQKGAKKMKLNSSCTTQYKVYNVEGITFSDKVTFKETKDHSKWAVTVSNTWTCIGDINRMSSQFHRAGGTACFQNPSVWKSFNMLISDVEPCPRD
ncbi:hypothetical protein ACJMK2_038387 [Sinanodonta woodiana]|uniref:Uncharacterized protein n=1 Tax=Sinanodonta woodiana TaxID=1069815 RepID=A0ABD3WA85_SINWO